MILPDIEQRQAIRTYETYGGIAKWTDGPVRYFYGNVEILRELYVRLQVAYIIFRKSWEVDDDL